MRMYIEDSELYMKNLLYTELCSTALNNGSFFISRMYKELFIEIYCVTGDLEVMLVFHNAGTHASYYQKN